MVGHIVCLLLCFHFFPLRERYSEYIYNGICLRLGCELSSESGKHTIRLSKRGMIETWKFLEKC